MDGDDAGDATLTVTRVSTTPNGCPVSAELRLEVGFTLDKPLPRAVWDIKVRSAGVCVRGWGLQGWGTRMCVAAIGLQFGVWSL